MRFYQFLLLALIIISFTSCSLNFNNYELKTDLDTTGENKAYISGTIIKNDKSDKPYHLILYKVIKEKDDKYFYQLVEFSTHLKNENFQFVVQPGAYFLYACQNPTKITEKRLGYEFYSDYVELNKKKNRIDIEVKMSNDLQEVTDDNILIETTTQKSILDKISFKEQKTLDDNIFKRDNASIGLWKPLEFFKNIGGGVYTLEKFDKRKIPVLFVHGMNGTPLDFVSIINKLDKNKFQALVYYYPTGINLNYSVDILKTVFDYIRNKYQIKKTLIVSHSMGGLVSRGFINIYKDKLEIPILITISTPWNGQKFAKLGEDYIKYLPPSFLNMIPGSVYQKKILEDSFPKNLKHHLLFGYNGKSSLVLEKSNDGTISLSSQLFEKAQNQSFEVYGFNENHISILKSKKVINKINTILDSI